MTIKPYPVFLFLFLPLSADVPHHCHRLQWWWWWNESAADIPPSTEDIIALAIEPHVNLMTEECIAPTASLKAADTVHPPETAVNQKTLGTNL